MLHVLFTSESNAGYFYRRLINEILCYSRLAITDVSLDRTANVVGKQILSTDYNPDGNDRSQDDVSSASEATTVISMLDSSTPTFKYQRIESDAVFGRHYKAFNCPVINGAYYASNPQEVDDVENNRLAFSADVRNWFEGRRVDVPLFKLCISTAHQISREPVVEGRYEVPLLVTAFDSDAARLLFRRLQQGTIFFKDRELEAIVKVYVLDPQGFRRYGMIIMIWSLLFFKNTPFYLQ